MATIYETKVNEAYIALLGRAADPAGLAYWADQLREDVEVDGDSIVNAIKLLTSQITQNAEWLSAPGLGANDPLTAGGATAIISGMYQNMFQRAAFTSVDTLINPTLPDEVGYWRPLFTSGQSTASGMAVDLIQGIKTEQKDTTIDPQLDGYLFSLKRVAAIYYTENIGSTHTDLLAKRAVSIVEDEATLLKSIALTDIALGRPVTLPPTLPGGFALPTPPALDSYDFVFTAAELNGATVDHTGSGDIIITDIGDSPFDLSNITSSGTGTVTAPIDGPTSLSKVTLLPPELVVTVPGTASLTMTADQADGLVLVGAGDVAVTDLDNSPIDLRFIGGTGVRTINIPENTTLNENTELGSFVLTVDNGVTLILTAAQVDGVSVTGDGNVIVTDLGSDAVDLSGINTTGTITVQVPDDAVLNAATDLGGLPVAVLSGATLTLTSAQADMQSVTGSGNVVVNDLDSGAYDLSSIANTGSKVAQVPSDAILNAATDLGAFDVEVIDPATLTLTAAQADGLLVAGDGSVIATALGTAPVDLSGVTATGSRTTSVTGPLALDEATNLGTFDVTVAADVLTLTAAQADGLNIDGPGAVTATKLGSEAVDLSNVTAMGAKVANVPADATLAALTDLGDFAVSVEMGATLTLSTEQANDLVATGAGNVTVSNLASGEVNLAGIAVMGNKVAVVPDSAILNAATDLGDFSVVVADGEVLALTAAQADGLAVDDQGPGTADVLVTDLGSDAVDLSGIVVSGMLSKVQVPADATLNAMTDVGALPIEVLSGAVLTVSTTQADGQTIFGAGSIAIPALNSEDIDLTNIATSKNSATITADATLMVDAAELASFSLTVAAGVTLTLTAEQANGLSVTGDGNVVLTGLGTDAVDLSGVDVAGSMTSAIPADLTLNEATDLGQFALTLADAVTLGLTAEQADERVITDGADTGNVTVSGLGSDSVDFRTIDVAGTKTAAVAKPGVTPAATETVVLAPTTELNGFALTVPDLVRLSLSSDQADGLGVTGDGAVTVTNLNGDVFDLSGIATVGANGSDDGANFADVSQAVALSAATNLGSNIQLRVSAPAGELTLTAAQADGLSVTGDGAIVINGVDGSALDFDNIADTLTRTARFPSSATQNAVTDLTGFTVDVAPGVTLTSASFDQANAYLTAVGGGSVVVVGTAADDNFDFDWVGVTQLLTGDAGADSFNANAGNVIEVSDFVVGTDSLTIDGSDASNAAGVATITIGSGDADFSSPASNVTNNGSLTIKANGPGSDDDIVGTAAVDTIDYSLAGPSGALLAGGVPGLLGGTTGISVTLDGGNAVDVLEGNTNIGDQNLLDLLGQADTIAGFENVNGTSADDTITGDGLANRLAGGGGNDTLNGAGGDDVIVGGDGADVIADGAGDDVVAGLLGDDTINLSVADSGVDEVHWRSIDGSDSVTGFTVTEDQLVFLDNGVTDGASGSVDFANSADTTAGAMGTALNAADFVDARGSFANIAATDAKVILADALVNTTNAVTNSYVLVETGGNTEIYFDTDYSDVSDAQLIATLVGVTGITLANIEVYTTV